MAPGSYISLFGTGLSDFTDGAASLPLTLSIDSASVSFDVPSANLSLPGRLIYVSPGQINVQIPWELQGQTSAQIKVTIEDTQGPLYTLPLADFSPAKLRKATRFLPLCLTSYIAWSASLIISAAEPSGDANVTAPMLKVTGQRSRRMASSKRRCPTL